jgi:NAD(P)-dependent dehydrogenase (short-subunit alcohol dehydrogenase family)
VDSFGRLDILVNNAGILRDKMSLQHGRVRLGRRHPGAPEGPLRPLSHFAAVYWRGRAKAGEEVSGRIINTSSEAGLFGNAGQANYSSGQGRHRGSMTMGPRPASSSATAMTVNSPSHPGPGPA